MIRRSMERTGLAHCSKGQRYITCAEASGGLLTHELKLALAHELGFKLTWMPMAVPRKGVPPYRDADRAIEAVSTAAHPSPDTGT
jgi:hypothetical protein